MWDFIQTSLYIGETAKGGASSSAAAFFEDKYNRLQKVDSADLAMSMDMNGVSLNGSAVQQMREVMPVKKKLKAGFSCAIPSPSAIHAVQRIVDKEAAANLDVQRVGEMTVLPIDKCLPMYYDDFCSPDAEVGVTGDGTHGTRLDRRSGGGAKEMRKRK